MKTLSDFSFIEQRLRERCSRTTVALACPHDSHTEYVIERALAEGFADFVLTTSSLLSERMQGVADRYAHRLRLIGCADAVEASRAAVAAVRSGDATVLMKGTVNTDVLLKAVLDKQCGLLEPGHVMSHITMSHIPAYGKLLMFSDAAVVPRPTLEQFDSIVRECAAACRRFGVEEPRIALTHCTEKVNPKFEHTISYTEIKARAQRGDYGSVVVDGPMDVKTALDAESSRIKGIASPVAGCADVIIFPNIESGNTFYKTITLFADAQTAGWLAGTTVPVVVASRADSEESKYYSLALACL